MKATPILLLLLVISYEVHAVNNRIIAFAGGTLVAGGIVVGLQFHRARPPTQVSVVYENGTITGDAVGGFINDVRHKRTNEYNATVSTGNFDFQVTKVEEKVSVDQQRFQRSKEANGVVLVNLDTPYKKKNGEIIVSYACHSENSTCTEITLNSHGRKLWVWKVVKWVVKVVVKETAKREIEKIRENKREKKREKKTHVPIAIC